MLFIVPQPISIDKLITQVKYEDVLGNIATITCLENTYQNFPEESSILNWEKIGSYTTNIKSEKYNKNISTWDEMNYDDFDLIVNIGYTKSIKVKSIIRSVSKYEPTIIID